LENGENRHRTMLICELFMTNLTGHYGDIASHARQNRWEICLRMRYILRGLRERDLGRVNTVI
jgi:hypothetical protein